MQEFTGEHPCWSVISIKSQSHFIEIAPRHGCSPVNLLHIFRTPFLKNTYGWLLLNNTFPHEKMGCNFVWNVLSQKRNINSGKLLMAFFPDFWIKRGKLLMVFPQTFHINVVTRSFEIQYVHELESTKIWPGEKYFKPGKPRFLERQFSRQEVIGVNISHCLIY